MRSLIEALGGRLLAIATALLVAPLLGAGLAPPTAASALDPGGANASVAVPMTGILPVCADGLWSDVATPSVWANDDGVDRFTAAAEKGLDQNCANQNWQDPNNPGQHPRASVVQASPDTVSINDVPTTITFQATAGTIPGPYNLYTDDCFPESGRAGGCANAFLVNVAYRLANGSGQFVGPWTRVYDAGDNPYFDFTRDLNGCADNYPAWVPADQHIGMPCAFELNFATNVSGAPILTSAMQVVLSLNLMSGTNGSSYENSTLLVTPMLFTPGGSTQLSLGPLPSSVPYGSTVTLSADAVGPAPGTTVSFFRTGPGGATTYVGQAATDAGGQASLVVTATGNAEYYASLTSPALESDKRSLGVTRVLGMKKIKKLEGRKVKITGTVSPDAAGEVHLQRKGKKGWTTVRKTDAKKKVSWTLKAPRGKSSWRILGVETADLLESVSRSRSVTLPDG